MKLTQPSLSLPAAPTVSPLSITTSSEQGLVRSGLLAEYRFNEGAGQVLHDYSGNNNHGMLGSSVGSDTNDPTWATTGTTFTTDDYIVLPAILAGKSAATILIAYYAASGNTAAAGLLAPGSSDNTNSNFAISLRKGAGDYLNLRASDGTNRAGVDSNGVSVIEAGYYLGIAKYAAGVSLSVGRYPNLMSTTTSSVPPLLNTNTTKLMYIGTYAGVYLTGEVYYVMIYGRVLTNAEITQNYNYLKGYLLRERGISI
jgi:hypothetical protein